MSTQKPHSEDLLSTEDQLDFASRPKPFLRQFKNFIAPKTTRDGINRAIWMPGLAGLYYAGNEIHKAKDLADATEAVALELEAQREHEAVMAETLETWNDMSDTHQEITHEAYRALEPIFRDSLNPQQYLDAGSAFALVRGEAAGEELIGQAATLLVTERRTHVDLFSRFGDSFTDQAYGARQYEWQMIDWLRERVLGELQNFDANEASMNDVQMAELSGLINASNEQIIDIVERGLVHQSSLQALIDAEGIIGKSDHYFNPHVLDFTPYFARWYDQCGEIMRVNRYGGEHGHQFHSSTGCNDNTSRFSSELMDELNMEPADGVIYLDQLSLDEIYRPEFEVDELDPIEEAGLRRHDDETIQVAANDNYASANDNTPNTSLTDTLTDPDLWSEVLTGIV